MSPTELTLRLVAVGASLMFLAAAVLIWIKTADERSGCLAFVLIVIAGALLLTGLNGALEVPAP